MEDHGRHEGKGHDNGCRYGKGVRLFLLFPEFIFDNFVVVRRFQVGKFRTLFPAGVLVATAMGAECSVIFDFGMAMRAEHN